MFKYNSVKNLVKDGIDLFIFLLGRPLHYLNYLRWKQYQRNHKIKKILIVYYGAVGDCVMATTAIQSIKLHFPDAQITIIGSNIFRQIYYNDNISFIKYDKKDFFSIIKKTRIQKFDIAFNLNWSSDRTALLVLMSHSKFTVGAGPRHWHLFYSLKAQPAYTTAHQVKRFVNITKAVGIKDNDAKPFIKVPIKYKEKVKKFFKRNKLNGKKVIFLHPGAKESYKCWPLKNYINLIRKIISLDDNYKFIIGWGPKEKKLADKIKRLTKSKWVILSEKTTNILHLAAFIQNADYFIGNCSAPMTIAMAVNTPSLIIMGPNNPVVWAPYGNLHQYIVPEKKCKKCKLPCPHGYICQTSIKVDKVFQSFLTIECPKK